MRIPAVVLSAVMVATCVACARQAPPPAPPPAEPQVVHADFVVEAEPPPSQPGQPGIAPASASPDPSQQKRAQAPDVKLLLGHYSNERRGIGAVIDRTEKEAKIRYDGTEEIIRLYPSPGTRGRIDYYKNAARVVMHVWDDGRVVVYLPSAKEGISLYRDADADPL